MKKIKEFITNNDKAVVIFLDVIIIFLGFFQMFNLVSNGFTAEQLDEPSAFCGFIFFLIFNSVLRIFENLFFETKSDKE